MCLKKFATHCKSNNPTCAPVVSVTNGFNVKKFRTTTRSRRFFNTLTFKMKQILIFGVIFITVPLFDHSRCFASERNQSNGTLSAISRTVSPNLKLDGRSSNSQSPSSNSNINGIDNVTARQSQATSTMHQKSRPYDQQDDYRIPFWNIAHMINSIDQIEPVLREGANGIEVDVSFDKKGVPIQTYHGFPCDCGRHCHYNEDFVKFVKHIGFISSPPESTKLQLILFDLKLKELGAEQKQTAGKYLASMIYENLYKKYIQSTEGKQGLLVQPPVRVIISINHASDYMLVRSFIDHMRTNRLNWMAQQVGFDVGMNDPLGNISAMWNLMHGSTYNIWQGDGLTNCANIIRGAERLKEAISIRNNQGHFRKIYYWTADVLYHIRSVLRFGLDAVLTNQPKRVVQVLEEPEFRGKYRLATPYDDPFAQFTIRPSTWQMLPPTLNETVETFTNIQKTSADFIKTLPDGINQVLKKVQNSIPRFG